MASPKFIKLAICIKRKENLHNQLVVGAYTTRPQEGITTTSNHAASSLLGIN